jgi:hypothetical protein
MKKSTRRSKQNLQGVAAFAVVNVEQPPYAQLANQPAKWFVNAPCFFNIDAPPMAKVFDDVGSDSDTQSDSDLEGSDHEQVNAIDIKRTNKKNMYPNIAVGCKSHVTYPGFGGMLPFEMQSITIECEKRLKTLQFQEMNDVKRIMCYNVSGRLATGEYNVKVKSSTKVARVFYDVSGTTDNAVFNMKSCMDRHDAFKRNNESTVKNILKNGCPARIEIAFKSPSPELDHVTLVNGKIYYQNIISMK